MLQEISFWGPLVPIGIIASTFSGELSGVIGSSRIRKALADDERFGSVLNFVKYGKTKTGNPLVAVCCSFLVAEVISLYFLNAVPSNSYEQHHSNILFVIISACVINRLIELNRTTCHYFIFACLLRS